MTIEIEFLDGYCTKECPYKQKYKDQDKIKKVGSILCTRECEYFVSEDQKNYTIECNYKEEEKC